jgi:hypothetical protein
VFAACFLMVSCLVYFSSMKMEIVSFSEISVTSSRTHNVVYQKVVNGARTSNPPNKICL